MASGASRMPADEGSLIPSPVRKPGRIRFWARAAVATQVLFVAAWLVAASWQGSRYSPVAHSISDMYAVTAPGGQFLVDVLTLCGLVAIAFTAFSVWPALRPGGWPAAVGCVLLAGFFLAAAMRRVPGWRAWAWPARAAAVLILVFAVGSITTQGASGQSGLFERLVAACGAAAIAALAVGILRRTASESRTRA